MKESWLEAALYPPRVHGAPLGRGTLRGAPEDFIVEEQLGFTPAGSGAHVLLKVRKRDANTQWVAGELAKACGCRPADVGYAGLKDRHALAVQWLSVPRSRLTPEQWLEVTGPGFEVLEAHAHTRKLPRGALAGNRFEIRVGGLNLDPDHLAERMREIGAHGVPNFFGPQRFGRQAANLARIADGVCGLKGVQRGFVLSAARSLVFNAVLAERIREGTWAQLETGDLANLDGRGSVFPVDALDESLLARCLRLDLHPTGPLWGQGAPATRGRVADLEARMAQQFSAACALIEQAGMEQERRSLRLAVRDLSWERTPSTLVIRFRLTRGSFATAVLREVLDAEEGVLDGEI
jgi:tRNA pseudouridine13 synthase